VAGGVLADPVRAGVHQRGDLGDVGLASGVGDRGNAREPRAGRDRDQQAEPVAEAGVDDGGDVAGSGQVPFGDGLGQDAGGVQAGQFGAAQGAPQPLGLVAGLPAVAGRQRAHQQVAVALVAGGGGLGGPDRVQDGQVVGVGQGLVAGLGGRALLAVAVQYPGQHGQRLPWRCGGGGSGLGAGSGGAAVVAGKFGGRARAGDRVGSFRRCGEDVGGVDVGAAGQGDVGMVAVLRAGDHREAGGHCAALGGVVGDRVPELGVFVGVEQEVSVGPAALPGGRVGVQGPADQQPAGGDGLDAEKIAVGEGPAGLARLGGVVVAGADDQVTRDGPGAAGDGDRGPRRRRCRG
jgi:hypothetical protein